MMRSLNMQHVVVFCCFLSYISSIYFFLLYSAFEGVDVVFHTAAADPSKNNLPLHYKVNVEG